MFIGLQKEKVGEASIIVVAVVPNGQAKGWPMPFSRSTPKGKQAEISSAVGCSKGEKDQKANLPLIGSWGQATIELNSLDLREKTLDEGCHSRGGSSTILAISGRKGRWELRSPSVGEGKKKGSRRRALPRDSLEGERDLQLSPLLTARLGGKKGSEKGKLGRPAKSPDGVPISSEGLVSRGRPLEQLRFPKHKYYKKKLEGIFCFTRGLGTLAGEIPYMGVQKRDSTSVG